MIDIISKRKWYFLISAVVILTGLVSLAVSGLKLGVDFSSGTALTIRFDISVEQGQLRKVLADLGYDQAILQKTGEGDYFIRFGEITSDQKDKLIAGLGAALKANVTIRDFYSVSPLVATETAQNAAIAVGVATIFMLLYIAWAFKGMPNPFRWGVCAIVALLHDVLVVIGFFSVLGWLAGVQVDSMFISAMLTIVGYSINNTVVVFDRLRENMSKGISKNFEAVVNTSILETLGRNLNTTLTTVFTILALFLFGGATIHNFVMALLIGVVTGLYTSILISSSLLVVWHDAARKKVATR